MSVVVEPRPLTPAEIRRAGEPRLRAAREFNAGLGCVAVLASLAAGALLGGLVLLVWLGGAWRWTFWGVTLAGVSIVLAAVGGLLAMLAACAVVSYVRRWWRVTRGHRPLVNVAGPTHGLRFEADAAWIIDNNDGEPVGVWRVGPDRFVLAPTLSVEFSMPPPGPATDDEPAAFWRMARAGRGVILPEGELGFLELIGPAEPTPVLVPPESVYTDAGDDVHRLLTDWNIDQRVLIKSAAELPRWLRGVVAAPRTG